jgi:hypothetical protein
MCAEGATLLDAALRGGAFDAADDVSFEIVRLAAVAISSGAVAAFDPLAGPGTTPLAIAVPCGHFPVQLSLVTPPADPEEDETPDAVPERRVAFAFLRLEDQDVARWEPLHTLAGANNHAVDCGVSSFADASISDRWTDRWVADRTHAGFLQATLAENEKRTWSWAAHSSSGGPLPDLVCFSSGVGDGLYSSYAGYGRSGFSQACSG